MRVLVTGGAGFIGSHLCERLLSAGNEVVIIDEMNDYYDPALKRRNLSTVLRAGPATVYENDICDQDAVFRIFEAHRPQAVVHLAARAGVRPSIELPLLYERTNCYGTTVLLEAAKRSGTPKFVFASSSSIYGKTNQVPFSEDEHLNLPISPYAATKIAGEKMCYTYSHLYGIQIPCLRFFTVYGPRQRPDLAIRKFAELILARKPVPMFGDGSMGRDYTFVDDTVSGILSALEFPCEFEVFNLGNSHPVSLKEMIQTLERALGIPAVIHQMPEQPGDVPITFADISKARARLGYRPSTTFEQGIAKFISWMREAGSLS